MKYHCSTVVRTFGPTKVVNESYQKVIMCKVLHIVVLVFVEQSKHHLCGNPNENTIGKARN